jgi:DNA-binding IclR family transcriptional regulator
MNKASPPTGLVKSADRALEILDFCARQRHPVPHAEIASSLGIPKSSVSALLSNMVEREYLAFDPGTNGYSLGVAVIALASTYLRELDLPRLGQAATQVLAAKVGESAALAVLAGKRVQVVARHNWVRPLMYAVQIGDTAPLHASASGKAILAFLPPKKCTALLEGYVFEQITPGTLGSRRALLAELSLVRSNGFACADQELVEGILTLAAPVLDGKDDVVAAISLSIPAPRLRRHKIEHLARDVCAQAESLSRALGAAPPRGRSAESSINGSNTQAARS